ncbi:MAG: hypothetical protein ACKV2T_35045 [Kofleriaceae bacterium]
MSWLERARHSLRGGDGAGVLPIGEALHPVTLLSLVVLVVNDWVLKPRLDQGLGLSVVTGKLSDVAGLAAAPVVLTALIGLLVLVANKLGARMHAHLTHRRLVISIVATGAVFAAIKLWPRASQWFVDALSVMRPAQVILDRTDLLCLPALAISYWIGRDELRRLARTSP